MLRGFILGTLVFCLFSFDPPPVCAQVMTEYMTLQSQVQGGTQQGVSEDHQDRAAARSVSGGDRSNDSPGSIMANITPMHAGIVLVLIMLMWRFLRA